METYSDIGIDIYGVFNILIPKGTLIPCDIKFKIKPTIDYKYFSLYEGEYKNIEKNNLISHYKIKKEDIDEVIISINKNNEINVKTGNYISDYICLNKDNNKDLNYSKSFDIEWFKREEQRILYIEYIVSLKETISDKSVKKIIDNKVYIDIIEKIKMAEKICYIEDVTFEEFILATKELENYINPILNKVVLKNSGEILNI